MHVEDSDYHSNILFILLEISIRKKEIGHRPRFGVGFRRQYHRDVYNYSVLSRMPRIL